MFISNTVTNGQDGKGGQKLVNQKENANVNLPSKEKGNYWKSIIEQKIFFPQKSYNNKQETGKLNKWTDSKKYNTVPGASNRTMF